MTSHATRRILAAATLALATSAVLLLTAGPASADTPEGWPKEEPVDMLEALLLLGGIPLLVIVVVTAVILGPSLARGESLGHSAPDLDSQWLGGPRKSAGELAAPDSEGSNAGGAGGTW